MLLLLLFLLFASNPLDLRYATECNWAFFYRLAFKHVHYN